jgi:hypothetical protein
MYLVDAAREPGCLLCTLIAARIRQHIEWLLYESVNDVGFRRQWREAVGFCPRHAWMLAEPQDALGMAILYLDLYESYGAGLARRRAGMPCRLCEHEAEVLKFALAELQRRWDEVAFANAVRDSDGLCLPHLRVVRRRLPHGSVLEALRAATLRTLRQMPADLRALIESFDYQHAPATAPRIKLAWRRALEQVVGGRDAPELA